MPLRIIVKAARKAPDLAGIDEPLKRDIDRLRRRVDLELRAGAGE